MYKTQYLKELTWALRITTMPFEKQRAVTLVNLPEPYLIGFNSRVSRREAR